MKKALKIIGLLGIAIVLFLAVAFFSLYHFIQVGEFRRFLIGEIEQRTGLKVKVGKAKLQLGRVIGISFGDLALIEPDNSLPVITAEKTLIRLALRPLLERKMVFNEIRFYRPTFRVERDAEGKISLLNLAARLPFQEQGGLPFTLDLREIRINQGEMTFTDHRAGRDPAVTYLRETDLNIRRIQSKELARFGVEPPHDSLIQAEGGMAVEFGLKAAVGQESSGDKGWIASKGKILFPLNGSEPKMAWLDADLQGENLPPILFEECGWWPLPSNQIRGALAPSLHWQGSLARRVRLQGQVGFKGLEIDAPNLFGSVVTPGDGRLELAVELTPQETRFTRLDIRSAEIHLSAQGALRPAVEKDPHLELNFTTPFLPLSAARKYLPWRALNLPMGEYLLGAMNQGEVRFTKAGVNGTLSQIRRFFEPGFEEHIWIDAEIKEAGGNLTGDRYLPLRGISGRVVLEKGLLYYKSFQGLYGQSRLAEVEGSQKGIFSGRRLLELRIRGEADLAQLRDQLKLSIIPAQAAKAVAVLQDINGKSRFGLLLRTDLVSSHHYDGKLSLENVRLRIGDVSLAQVKGELMFSPREIRAEKATALLAGFPLNIRLVLRNYLSDRSDFDLTVDSSGVRAGEALRLLLSEGSPQDPGTVRGRIRYQGPLSYSGERTLSGSLELVGVYLPLKFFQQPLREVRGKVVFDGKGIDLQGFRAQLAGYGISFGGRLRYLEKPQLIFTLDSPEMDVALILPQEASLGNQWYDRLQARGRISISKGKYQGFEFSDLKTDLTLAQRVWRLDNFSARSLGGIVQGVGTFTDSAESLGFSIEPKIQGVPVQGFLGWFDTGTKEITGSVNLTGKLESSGATGAARKRNLSGNFQLEIKDGMARRMQLFVRILNLMDLTRWFSFQLPDLTQKGIRFRSMTGDFKVKKGVYVTENLLVDSDDLSITGAGQYDGPNDAIDAILALRPFPRLGSVVSYIPLIGPGLAGVKDSVMVASFHVQGPVDDATITPAPLSTLSEFFFGALKIPQKLITIPGSGKK